jgi:thioredoxin 1
MSDIFLIINDDNFEETLASNKCLLVDFWATWCNPCRMLLPIMEEYASENADVVKVGKVNVDDSPNLAQRFGVMTIPTVILFVDGEMKDKFIGFRQKAQITAFVDKNRA